MGSNPTLSAMRPLRWRTFRWLWVASLASYLGTWVHEVGAAWLITTLTDSPALVALLQAAMTLPIFLLALPAGALADVVDRRRLLLAAQAGMLLAAAGLGLLTIADRATPAILLGATFLLGVGWAVNAPAWQAIVPELVAAEDLAGALALNGVAINLARAAGPAIGGLAVAAAGPGAAFLLNAVSFIGVLAVLARWRRPPRSSPLPAERFLGAMATGLRYARHAPELRAVLLRSGAFILSGSAFWALLPLVGRFRAGLGPTGYGLAVGAMGAGAVAGAALMPRLRRFSPAALVGGGSLVFAAGLAAMAAVRQGVHLGIVLVPIGVAWLVLLTTFHTSAQILLPGWVRGRGLAVYLLAFFGCMAIGSAAWGLVAHRAGLEAALLGAAAGVVAGWLLTARLRLHEGPALHAAPSRHWPAAEAAAGAPEADGGPVLVTVEYRIDPRDADAFAAAMREVRRVRRRDGAIRWHLLNDSDDPARFVESFLVESWIEHLRQHERITPADREIEGRARAFHRGGEPPAVSHFVARDLPRGPRS